MAWVFLLQDHVQHVFKGIEGVGVETFWILKLVQLLVHGEKGPEGHGIAID